MTPHHARPTTAIAFAVLAIAAGLGHVSAADTWNGLTVAPEHRCAPYDRGDYPYPRSIEREIVDAMGGHVYGPYSGRHYRSMLLFPGLSDLGFPGLFRVTGARNSRIDRSLPEGGQVAGVSDGRRRVKPLRGSSAALRPFG